MPWGEKMQTVDTMNAPLEKPPLTAQKRPWSLPAEPRERGQRAVGCQMGGTVQLTQAGGSCPRGGCPFCWWWVSLLTHPSLRPSLPRSPLLCGLCSFCRSLFSSGPCLDRSLSLGAQNRGNWDKMTQSAIPNLWIILSSIIWYTLKKSGGRSDYIFFHCETQHSMSGIIRELLRLAKSVLGVRLWSISFALVFYPVFNLLREQGI